MTETILEPVFFYLYDFFTERSLKIPNIFRTYPANIYLLKVKNRNTCKRCAIYSKLTIKTPERRQRRRSGIFTVNFEHILHLFLVFVLLYLNKYMLAGYIP